VRFLIDESLAVVMWTGKSFFSRYSAEVVVPVVHRRGPAVRVARIDAQAERTAGRCLWTRWVGEQHVQQDLGFIPSFADWMRAIRPLREVLYDWMKPAAIGGDDQAHIVYNRALIDFAGALEVPPESLHPRAQRTDEAPISVLLMKSSSSAEIGLGIPDWRQPSGYPNPGNLWISDWRWEFLRRKPRYRQDYDRPELSYVDESKARYFERVYFLASPIDPQLSAADYVRSCETELFRPDHFDVFIGSRSFSSKYAHGSEVDRIMHHRSNNDIFFRVDPLKPLEAQFKVFVEIARKSQRSLLGRILTPRARPTKWPLYLRVLDARDCDAAYSEIARVCLKHEDPSAAIGAARDLTKQARKLRDNWPFASEEI
jgi:hypothetical protein